MECNEQLNSLCNFEVVDEWSDIIVQNSGKDEVSNIEGNISQQRRPTEGEIDEFLEKVKELASCGTSGFKDGLEFNQPSESNCSISYECNQILAEDNSQCFRTNVKSINARIHTSRSTVSYKPGGTLIKTIFNESSLAVSNISDCSLKDEGISTSDSFTSEIVKQSERTQDTFLDLREKLRKSQNSHGKNEPTVDHNKNNFTPDTENSGSISPQANDFKINICVGKNPEERIEEAWKENELRDLEHKRSSRSQSIGHVRSTSPLNSLEESRSSSRKREGSISRIREQVSHDIPFSTRSRSRERSNRSWSKGRERMTRSRSRGWPGISSSRSRGRHQSRRSRSRKRLRTSRSRSKGQGQNSRSANRDLRGYRSRTPRQFNRSRSRGFRRSSRGHRRRSRDCKRRSIGSGRSRSNSRNRGRSKSRSYISLSPSPKRESSYLTIGSGSPAMARNTPNFFHSGLPYQSTLPSNFPQQSTFGNMPGLGSGMQNLAKQPMKYPSYNDPPVQSGSSMLLGRGPVLRPPTLSVSPSFPHVPNPGEMKPADSWGCPPPYISTKESFGTSAQSVLTRSPSGSFEETMRRERRHRSSSRSRSRSRETRKSHKKKSKKHSRSPDHSRKSKKHKYSDPSPPEFKSRDKKMVFHPDRIPTPPPPPILSGHDKKESSSESGSKTIEKEKDNVTLSSLLEAVMENSGVGKSQVSNPKVKKKILSACETKIRLLYKKRISGLGAFIPEPTGWIRLINTRCSPLVMYHPHLSFNEGLEETVWRCPSVKTPPVKLILQEVIKPSLEPSTTGLKDTPNPDTPEVFPQNQPAQNSQSSASAYSASVLQASSGITPPAALPQPTVMGQIRPIHGPPQMHKPPSIVHPTPSVQQPPHWQGYGVQNYYQQFPTPNCWNPDYQVQSSWPHSQPMALPSNNAYYGQPLISYPIQNTNMNNLNLSLPTNAFSTGLNNVSYPIQTSRNRTLEDINLIQREPSPIREKEESKKKKRSLSPLRSRRSRERKTSKRSSPFLRSPPRRYSPLLHSPSRRTSPQRRSSPRRTSPLRRPSPVRRPSPGHRFSPSRRPSPPRRPLPIRHPSPVRRLSPPRRFSPTSRRKSDKQSSLCPPGRKSQPPRCSPDRNIKNIPQLLPSEKVQVTLPAKEKNRNKNPNLTELLTVKGSPKVEKAIDNVKTDIDLQGSVNDVIKISSDEEDISTGIDKISTESDQVITCEEICKIGMPIRDIQEKSQAYKNIITSLQQGDLAYRRLYTFENHVLCKKVIEHYKSSKSNPNLAKVSSKVNITKKLLIALPRDGTKDFVTLLHKHFHDIKQYDLHALIYKNVTAFHPKSSNIIKKVFSDCPDCKASQRNQKVQPLFEIKADKKQSNKFEKKPSPIQKKPNNLVKEKSVGSLLSGSQTETTSNQERGNKRQQEPPSDGRPSGYEKATKSKPPIIKQITHSEEPNKTNMDQASVLSLNNSESTISFTKEEGIESGSNILDNNDPENNVNLDKKQNENKESNDNTTALEERQLIITKDDELRSSNVVNANISDSNYQNLTNIQNTPQENSETEISPSQNSATNMQTTDSADKNIINENVSNVDSNKSIIKKENSDVDDTKINVETEKLDSLSEIVKNPCVDNESNIGDKNVKEVVNTKEENETDKIIQNKPDTIGNNCPAVVVEDRKETTTSEGSSTMHLSKTNNDAGMDFKSRVRCVQKSNNEFSEIMHKLEAKESVDGYILRAGMLCKKKVSGGSTEIKILAPESSIKEVVSIVHTMSVAHTPQEKVIAFFKKHFSPVEDLETKVKSFIDECLDCKK